MVHQQKQNNVTSIKALPPTPEAAVHHMIRVTDSLMGVAEKETQSLLTGDMMAFAILQYEKEKLAGQYVRSSEEFRTRLEEFRNLDKKIINQLEKRQKDLAEKTRGNNELVQRIRRRLKAVDPVGRVRFSNNTQQQTTEGV